MELGIWFKVRNRISTSLQGVLFPLFFASFGRGARILRPLRINGSANITIGRDVFINNFAWLETIASFQETPALEIQRGAYIGNSAHIIATQSIVIEADVLIADRVYIADYAHGYRNVNTPVKLQPLTPRAPVRIGTGTWIGENVAVIGCTIGRNCVIGANAVVTTDIPDYCVAVGAPAKVIRRWNAHTKEWTVAER
ncbi:acetyltransferase [Caballeronia mineralivorans PML1(12)]|uniref:Acetyltransferase n=1 Tax=Caballeronia mineralivorans PML1(12) TaxID=908627 RepID=A0A0J1CS91_9BURK|nr:DapH/DapD/GlmU-related protein [Caballeronia mineralivorans]KLU23544.1 acetyltransferase [Caballeronia mineralivorans PML1(12)]